MKKRRRFPIRIVRRRTKKGKYTRLLFGKRVIVGKNEHEFKGRMTKHYHIGGRFVKIVTKPKELRGLWFYRRGKGYVRFRIRKKAKRNRRGDKET
jgi:hypothetical protein